MRPRLRGSVLWLAASMVLIGSAFAFAHPTGNHGADVSTVARPDAPPPGADHGDAVSAVASANAQAGGNGQGQQGERPHNHGFFVSKAAGCEAVEGNPAVPADCETDGKVRGEYVSTVARSDAGKPENAGGPPD